MKPLMRGVLLIAAMACLGLGFGLPQLRPGSIDAGLAGLLGGLGVGLVASLVLGSVLRRLLPAPCDAAPPALRQRHTREMMRAMSLYALTLVVSLLLLKQPTLHSWLRAVLALTPVLPVALVLRAMIRYIRDVDELQQRIELESVCFATATVCLLYMAGGFLQVADVIAVPAGVAMLWVFPLICMSYGLAKVVVARRYR